MKASKTIRKQIALLRKLIDTSKDPCEQKIAYAMEHCLRWATLRTVGWPTLDKDAKMLAQFLRKKLNVEKGI